MELETIERWTLLDSIDGAVEHLHQFVEVGVSEILLLTLGRDPLHQYERLAEVRARLEDARGRVRDRSVSATAGAYRYDPSAYRQVFEHRFTYLAGVKRNSHRFADRTALTDTASGRSWTYAELWADAGRLAAALAQADVRAGEVIVFALFNGAEFVLSWLAAQRLGAIAAPINFRLSAGEIAHVLDDSQPAVFIYDQALELVAADAITRAEHQPRLLIAAGADTAPALSFDAFLSSGRGRRRPAAARAPRRRAGDLRRDHAAVHVGHDRDAEGRVAVLARRGAVGPRRDHALPALARGPHAEHDAVVSPRRALLRRPQPGPVRRRRGGRAAASSIRRRCSIQVAERGLTFLIGAPTNLALLSAEQLAAPA